LMLDSMPITPIQRGIHPIRQNSIDSVA